MYVDELRANRLRTLGVTCGCVAIASAIAASNKGWLALPQLLRNNGIIGFFVGLLFWFAEPPIKAYAARLGFLWQWTFRVVSWTAVMNGGILCGLAGQAAVGVLPWADYATLFWQSFVPATLICLVCCTAFTIYQGMKYKLHYEVTQARLASLESRLRPHFLFNTLNSIVALIPDDPASAERVTLKLADLLRYSLDSGDRSTVPLEQELKMMRDYLEIEKTRFGARLSYSVDVPVELERFQVPPFCLQTLVENSVKYGGDELRIRAHNGDRKLVLTVWDSGEGFAGKQNEIPGHGLHDLRKRLAALWGSDASLEYRWDPGGTVVEVSIPSRTNP